MPTKQWKKVGAELSYPVTADMFENPEDDWLATASSRARARVEVNIKKLSAEERAQFRAAQHKEMDQWISNDVISIFQKAGIPKERTQHQLDQCTFMFVNGPELVELIGVYVDEFLVWWLEVMMAPSSLGGIEIETLSDGGLLLRQKFADQLELLSHRCSRADTVC